MLFVDSYKQITYICSIQNLDRTRVIQLFLQGDEKKESKLDMTREAAQKRNAKAFGVNSAVAMRKKFNVSQDRKSNKEFIPVVKNQSDEPPPLIVALVGPPKVGKSTLIKSLIKVRYLLLSI